MKLPKGIRSFNKHVLNHLTGKLARAAWGPFCVLYHVGRRSAKPYETVLIAIPAASSFVIALTYGQDVDWYRNVRGAGRCRILWHHQEFAIDQIEPMEPESALPYFPAFERTILKLVGISDFIQMEYEQGP